MKGATKAMVAMNKVNDVTLFLLLNTQNFIDILPFFWRTLFSANGTNETSQSDQRFPEAICTAGHDGKNDTHLL